MADPTNGVLNADFDSEGRSSLQVTIQFFDDKGEPISATEDKK